MMMGSFTLFIAIVALIVVVWRQQQRLRVLEFDLDGLRKAFLAHRETVSSASQQPVMTAPVAAEPAPALPEVSATIPDAVDETNLGEAQPETLPPGGPWAAATQTQPDPQPATAQYAEAPTIAAAPAKKPDIETALGTRWAVWVGGVALALGGIFLVRYSIEAGIFGPAVRLFMAGLLGVLLLAGGEFVRRTGFKMPVDGVQNAYVPGILTAAGAFTLFGTIYAAHGIYGFIGPAPAFILLAMIGVATIAAALVHGQALAGVGLLGSFITPVLVSSNAPNPWALFGFLAVVLASTAVIARMRSWAFLMAAAFIGTGFWCLIYLLDASPADLAPVVFINAVTLAVLAFVWLRGDVFGGTVTTVSAGVDKVSIAPAVLVAVAALLVGIVPELALSGGTWIAAALVIALALIAVYRYRAIALLYAAGVATLLIYFYSAFGGTFDLQMWTGYIEVNGVPVTNAGASFVPLGLVIGPLFFAAGIWMARRFAPLSRYRAMSWAGWAVLVPVGILASTWLAYGNIDRDLTYAFVALALACVLAAGAEAIARAEQPPLEGGPAVSFALAGAGVSVLLMLHMAFGAGWTTVTLGLAAAVPALVTRYRSYPALGWMSVGAVVVEIARVAFDPTIVGAMDLGTTPVFNWLLAGYGVPALGFAFAAWQLTRTTNGRPRFIMEAAAALFALLTIAMLVRHAMNGGVIDAGAPSLAEQAIYTLIAIGAGAILIALDARSPSPVFRLGSMVAGVASVAFIVLQHFAVLNPLFTNESTGSIPFFNLLFLAYLLPGAAMGALALYARPKRPQWYVAMLAVVAALLVFVYATLSVRRWFQGEFIGGWKGFGQVETYSYSALWLFMGVALLVAGLLLKSRVLRLASVALVVVAVAKVFLFDMRELEGVLRALSFIGLGGVLIGIGLFYQRMLSATQK